MYTQHYYYYTFSTHKLLSWSLLVQDFSCYKHTHFSDGLQDNIMGKELLTYITHINVVVT